MDAKIEKRIATEHDMESWGEVIAAFVDSGDLIYLAGELGAGKTTLARGIARGLGYKGRVTSPTFTLMNVYAGDLPIYHFDFYRLDENSLFDLGLEDYLGREGVCVIEWPDAGFKQLPSEALLVDIILENNDYELPRRVIIRGLGQRAQLIIERLKALVDSGH